MKVRELMKFLENDGWYLDRTKRSYLRFKLLTKTGTLTVAGKPGVDVPHSARLMPN